MLICIKYYEFNLPGLTAVNNWTFAQKLLFRFFAAYLLFTFFHFLVAICPQQMPSLPFYGRFWDMLVPRAGKNILHISYTIIVQPNGSGDTTITM